MEAANASLYDGGTAIFEAVLMAVRITRRNKIIVDESVSPIYRRMLDTYTASIDVEIVVVPNPDGCCSREGIADAIDNSTAAVIFANPNFMGCLDDLSDVAELAHAAGALMVVSTYPTALGIIKTPGEMNADIVTGEGQSLGLGLNFGGPGLGFMATRKKYMRKMPGRIVGRTADNRGGSGFVLTLQAREQHIRREKATSNICTNQGLCALTALVYLSLLGKQGLVELASTCATRAKSAAEALTAIDGVTLKFPGRSFFNEFVLSLPKPAGDVCERLLEKNILAGIPLGKYYPGMDNCLLVAVTEKCTDGKIANYARCLEELL